VDGSIAVNNLTAYFLLVLLQLLLLLIISAFKQASSPPAQQTTKPALTRQHLNSIPPRARPRVSLTLVDVAAAVPAAD
jgi:hypothetical protein